MTHEVIQSDREIAAIIWRDYVAKRGECITENAIRRGSPEMDQTILTQAFAAHRIAATQEAERRIVEWLRDFAEVLESEGTAPMNKAQGAAIRERANAIENKDHLNDAD